VSRAKCEIFLTYHTAAFQSAILRSLIPEKGAYLYEENQGPGAKIQKAEGRLIAAALSGASACGCRKKAV
jgi:hypothetical protein